MNPSALIQPDRVHKSVYTDPQIFASEMENIFEKVWVYCGHASQIPNPGDYYAVTIGRQPMMMVRAGDGSVRPGSRSTTSATARPRARSRW